MNLVTDKKVNAAKQTALLKKFIRQRLNIDVKVSKKWFSGGNSLDVYYNLGCAAKHVEQVVNCLQEGDFDGMNDIYEYRNSATYGMNLNGCDMDTFSYVFVHREVSDDFVFELAKAISEKFKYSEIHECKTMEDFKKQFISPHYAGCWNWYNMVYRELNKLNFVAQDESKIKILYAYEVRKIGVFDNIHFVYEYEGQQYNTETIEVKKETEIKKATKAEQNNIRIVDYSDKAIAVYGETYELREEFKQLGGRYNKFLKDGAGWIFSKRVQDELANLIISYHETTK